MQAAPAGRSFFIHFTFTENFKFFLRRGAGLFYLSSLRFLKIIVSSFDALGGLFAGCVCGALFDFLYAF